MNRPTNIYELLGDENDEEIKKVPQAAAAKKEEPKKTVSQAKPAKSTQAAEQKGKETRPPRQDRADRKPREFAPDTQQVGEGGFERKGGNRPPRQQRDRDPERRQRTAEATARGGNRVFDRRSGTGRGREGKRNGAGRGNWGTNQDEQKAQVEETETKETQEAPVETKEAAEQPQAEQEAPKEEEEEKTKTLEEYMKELKKPAVALPEARKATEVSNPKWKEYTALTRSFEGEGGFLFKDEEQPTKGGKKETQEAAKKGVRADEVLNFTEGSPKSFRGGRGGARGGRGGARGGRGGARGGRSGPAPNFSDKSAFPDLATKA